jgi:hypothetical protein
VEGHGLRVSAGPVAGVTAFGGLGNSVHAALAQEVKAPVSVSQTAIPQIVIGYMTFTESVVD